MASTVIEAEDFRFHDLRHSAASYLAMSGASLAVIAEILGHKTLAMVKRYAHLSEAHTRSVVEPMNRAVFGEAVTWGTTDQRWGHVQRPRKLLGVGYSSALRNTSSSGCGDSP